MADLILRGNRRLARKLQRMKDVRRISGPAVERAIKPVWRIARRRGFGFRDRTGLLRRSLRIERARTRIGRFAVGWQLVASTKYAHWVEYRRRTRDRRPGPPYWLHRAMQVARNKVRGAVRRNVEHGIHAAARRR